MYAWLIPSCSQECILEQGLLQTGSGLPQGIGGSWTVAPQGQNTSSKPKFQRITHHEKLLMPFVNTVGR